MRDAMGAHFSGAKTRLELAEAPAVAGDAGGAQQVLEVAEPVLRGIGAAPALARVAALQAVAGTEAPATVA